MRRIADALNRHFRRATDSVLERAGSRELPGVVQVIHAPCSQGADHSTYGDEEDEGQHEDGAIIGPLSTVRTLVAAGLARGPAFRNNKPVCHTFEQAGSHFSHPCNRDATRANRSLGSSSSIEQSSFSRTTYQMVHSVRLRT